MYEMCAVYKRMLDPIITSYQLTTIVSVTYNRIQQYPVKYIYNITINAHEEICFKSNF